MQSNELVHRQAFIRVLYDRLLESFGPRRKWFGTDNRFEICVGAILVQSTAWRNVEKAVDQLRGADALHPRAIVALTDDQLTELIRPAGFAVVKRRRLRAFAEMVVAEFGGELDRLLELPYLELREKLLTTHGIGRETADVICVYAARYPSFVMDAYAERIFGRIGLSLGQDIKTVGEKLYSSPRPITSALGYGSWKTLVESSLPSDATLLGEFHALLIQLGKRNCVKQRPRCADCPVWDLCLTGRATRQSTHVE